MCSSGVPAVSASTIAPAALPAAVPVLVRHTPIWPVVRAQASAMLVAPASPRAGTQNLIRSLATEFAPKGVRVNSILIGLVESGQWQRRFDAREDKALDWAQWTAQLAARKGIQLGRLGKPEEAAQAIVFLATPMSSYTTGGHIDISGGLARHI